VLTAVRRSHGMQRSVKIDRIEFFMDALVESLRALPTTIVSGRYGDDDDNDDNDNNNNNNFDNNFDNNKNKNKNKNKNNNNKRAALHYRFGEV